MAIIDRFIEPDWLDDSVSRSNLGVPFIAGAIVTCERLSGHLFLRTRAVSWIVQDDRQFKLDDYGRVATQTFRSGFGTRSSRDLGMPPLHVRAMIRNRNTSSSSRKIDRT